MFLMRNFINRNPSNCSWLSVLTTQLLLTCTLPIFQSVVDVKDGKFVEIHRDKDDPKLDATMTREVEGNQLTVVSDWKSAVFNF